MASGVIIYCNGVEVKGGCLLDSSLPYTYPESCCFDCGIRCFTNVHTDAELYLFEKYFIILIILQS